MEVAAGKWSIPPRIPRIPLGGLRHYSTLRIKRYRVPVAQAVHMGAALEVQEALAEAAAVQMQRGGMEV